MSKNQHIFELGLTPPPGVAFIQWGDGSIRIRYAVKDVVPIRGMLLNLARSLTEQALKKLSEERDVEIAKQKMPLSKLQSITQEMHKLQREMTGVESETQVDLSMFERAIDETIRQVQDSVDKADAQSIINQVVTPAGDDPVIVIGRVVPDTED